MIIMVGAPGGEPYVEKFTAWAKQWEKTALAGGAQVIIIGLETNSAEADRDRLKQSLEKEEKDSPAELWLVLIGHGTFNGKDAKFNARGADFSHAELAEWLKPFHRPLAVIDTTSASAPYLNQLSATGRVVITATRSGQEVNFARFGQYLAEAIGDPAADLDKDGQTSLLEAWLMAARRTGEFYSGEGRLATEHPLLDDNGDRLGTPPDWFRGIRAVKKAKEGAALDGVRAHQFQLVRSAADLQLSPEARARRDDLEFQIAEWRDRKPRLNEDDYYRTLEAMLLELAHLYAEAVPHSE